MRTWFLRHPTLATGILAVTTLAVAHEVWVGIESHQWFLVGFGTVATGRMGQITSDWWHRT